MWNAAFILLLGCAAFARPHLGRSHKEDVAPFSIDVDGSYQNVLAAVTQVAGNGVITGTFEYKDTQNLPGAELTSKCTLFEPWEGPGKILYKVRKRALAPTHFVNSNDAGTVAVRYVVQEMSPKTTRLFIDAVFVESSGHHRDISDGYVETTEFGAIAQRLKDADQERLVAGQSDGQPFSSSRPAANQPAASAPAPASSEAVDSDASDLQRVIAAQENKLAEERADLQLLQSQVEQTHNSVIRHVTALRAEMKMFPYQHAQAVQALKKGQEVTIVASTPNWFRVRSADGQEGWVFRTLLEAQP